jgi:uncharacterized protein YodC (DUF2158 family)
MNNQFKKGDRVILKSGGPVMTVKEVSGQDIVCEWYESGKGFDIRSFDQEELTPAPSPKK